MKKGLLSNPAPGENIISGNLVMETGCTEAVERLMASMKGLQLAAYTYFEARYDQIVFRPDNCMAYRYTYTYVTSYVYIYIYMYINDNIYIYIYIHILIG